MYISTQPEFFAQTSMMNALCLVALCCLSLSSFTAGKPLEFSLDTVIPSEGNIDLENDDAYEANVIAPTRTDGWFRRKWNNIKRSKLGQWMEKFIERVERWWRS